MATPMAILVIYYLTTVLTSSEGFLGIFYRLRKLKYLSALKCFLCASLYVSAIVALLLANNVEEFVVYTLAGAGGATALDRLTLPKV